MKTNDFDSIAKWYDRLVNLVFGQAIKNAQTHFLKELPIDGRLLIMGGGTGWILEEIASIRPNLKVEYIEASLKMLSLAKEASIDELQVKFTYGTEKDIASTEYDVIITNFFLDVFEPNELSLVMHHLKGCLSKNGIWLCSDFQKTNKFRHKILLKAMHVFFGLISKLEAKKLMDFDAEFQQLGLHVEQHRLFYKGMIFSSVYRLT